MLSERLKCIYDMTPASEVVADVGTDHGYLPIALVKGGKAQIAYAMDINKGPLEKAAANVKDQGETGRVTTILSDGLEKLPEGVETVVIAGMGGMLIGRILTSEKSKVDHLKYLILSPHLDEVALRRQIHSLGWSIESEEMVVDKDKFYTVMRCIKGDESYTELEYTYGRCLMEEKSQVWLASMARKLKKLRVVEGNLKKQSTGNAASRLEAVIEEINEIREVSGIEG